MPVFQLNRVGLTHQTANGSIFFDDENHHIEYHDSKGAITVLASDSDTVSKATWTECGTRDASLQLYMNGFEGEDVLMIKEEKTDEDALTDGKKDGEKQKIVPRFYRIHGINQLDESKIKDFLKLTFNVTLEPEPFDVRGGNYGQLEVSKLRQCVLLQSYDQPDQIAMELPLANVMQVAAPGNKGEIEIQYSGLTSTDTKSDKFELTLARLYIPLADDDENLPKPEDGEDEDGEVKTAVDRWRLKMQEVSSMYDDGNEQDLGLVCKIDEEWCNFNAPKGKYRLDVYKDFFRMRGKTYDFKIPYSTITQFHLLEHPERFAKFLVISLSTPVLSGKQKLSHLVMTVEDEDDELNLELSDEELNEKYPDGNLQKTMKGKMPEMIGKLLKVVSGKKVFVMPSTGFQAAKEDGEDENARRNRCVRCSNKSSSGFLFPMKHSMLYLHKPQVLYIRYDKIEAMEFKRHQGGSAKTFDLEILVTDAADVGTTNKKIEFLQIPRNQFDPLSKFFSNDTKINIRNKTKLNEMFAREATGKRLGITSFVDFGEEDDDEDDEDDSDFDAEVERKKKKKKAEGEEGGDGEDDDDDEDESSGGSGSSSEDEGESDSDMAEEVPFDEDEIAAITGDALIVDGKRKRTKIPIEKKSKKSKSSEASPASGKKKKDKNAPRQAKNAYAIFMAEKSVEYKNKGMDFKEISKAVSEAWKKLEDKSTYEQQAQQDKERYKREMQAYRAEHGGGDESESPKKAKKDPNAPKGVRSAYNFYMDEHRPEFKGQGLSFGETTKKLAEMWNSLPEGDKEKYNEMARKDKERHVQEMAEYEAKGGAGAAGGSGEARKKKPAGEPKRKKAKALGGGELPSASEDSSSEDDSSSDDTNDPDDDVKKD